MTFAGPPSSEFAGTSLVSFLRSNGFTQRGEPEWFFPLLRCRDGRAFCLGGSLTGRVLPIYDQRGKHCSVTLIYLQYRLVIPVVEYSWLITLPEHPKRIHQPKGGSAVKIGGGVREVTHQVFLKPEGLLLEWDGHETNRHTPSEWKDGDTLSIAWADIPGRAHVPALIRLSDR